MSELIDRQAALKALRKCQTYLYDARDPELKIELSSAEAAINNLSTIQPEKAQLFKEGTTSDLISKKETVERLRRMFEATVPNTDYDEGFIDGVEFGISTVSTMPTVQPVATDTNVGDKISRQAAIDAIVQCTNCGDEDTLREYVLKHSLDNGWTGGILEALDAVRDLPPAQPEPQEGHWIGKYPTTHICSECGWLIPDSKVKVFAYCPNCGADMRGEKDERTD